MVQFNILRNSNQISSVCPPCKYSLRIFQHVEYMYIEYYTFFILID